MKKSYNYLFVAIALCSAILSGINTQANDSSVINIQLSKDKINQWQVNYRLPKPVTQLLMLRSPDESRAKRWKALDNHFQITSYG